MDVQAVDKQRRMLRPIAIPAVLEHVICKLPYGVKVLVRIVRFCQGRGGQSD
jgi:hypothetical protein